MNATRTNDFEATSSVTPSSLNTHLNVVLLYEDFEMGVEGKRIFELVAREAGGESAARLTLWRFDFFHSAELTLAVSRQAEEADVIIVAPRDPDHLPPQVKAWLERWPQKRRRESGALIAVFHPAMSSIAESSNTALLLWRAASRAAMDFICRTTTEPARPAAPETTPAEVTIQAARPTTFTGNFPIGSTGWGLND